MAKATLIASLAQSGVVPKSLHAGVISVTSIYSLTATLSVSDLIQMVRLPDGARLVDAYLNYGGLATGRKLNVGTRSDHDLIIASASAATAATWRNLTVNAPGYRFNVSDAAANKFTMVEVQASDGTTTGTKSGAISLTVLYQMEDGYQ